MYQYSHSEIGGVKKEFARGGCLELLSIWDLGEGGREFSSPPVNLSKFPFLRTFSFHSGTTKRTKKEDNVCIEVCRGKWKKEEESENFFSPPPPSSFTRPDKRYSGTYLSNLAAKERNLLPNLPLCCLLVKHLCICNRFSDGYDILSCLVGSSTMCALYDCLCSMLCSTHESISRSTKIFWETDLRRCLFWTFKENRKKIYPPECIQCPMCDRII